jgi:hypothetical protein
MRAQKGDGVVQIEFDTDNSAFVENFDGEVATILRNLANRMARGGKDDQVRDSNGNTIGWIKVDRESNVVSLQR